MRTRPVAAVLSLAFAVACRSTGEPPPAAEEGGANVDGALARCIGGGSGARDPVIAGVENDFFTATSRQVLRLKEGVEAQRDPDAEGADGGKGTLTLARDGDSLVLTCGCPGGCSQAGDGCVYIVPIGDQVAYCVGDCAKTNACCAGCGWY